METNIKNRVQLLLGSKVVFIFREVIIYSFLVLFVYVATDKLYHYREFTNVLTLVPFFGKYHSITAPLIIAVQIVISVMLLLPKWKALGLHATLILLVIFTSCLIIMLCYTKVLPCSCAGIAASLSWKAQMWLNILLIALAGLGILSTHQIKSSL